MKKLILILFVVLGIAPVFGQQTGKYKFVEYREATEMLCGEINKYRARYLLPSLAISEKIEKKSREWNEYMVNHYIDLKNNSYKHANQGPEEYHYQCAEIIHMIYFNHEPSDYEMVVALMYGWLANKDRGKIKGWIDSPGHDEILKLNYTNFMGASVALFKGDSWWICIGVVKFNTNE